MEQLWGRYAKAVNSPDADWPTPGPPPPWKLLWAVTDARDAARAFALALAAPELRYPVLHINGADTCSLLPTTELISRHHPGVHLVAPLAGTESLISFARAEQAIGYQPQYSWRNSEFASWLAEWEGR